MAVSAVPEVNKRLVIPAVSSNYSSLGTFNQGEYKIDYSDSLVKTSKDYRDSKKIIPADMRMSLPSEELAIQMALKKLGIDPRSEGAETFNDLFGRNNWYAWQWTEMALRTPKGRSSEKYETDKKGRKLWVREVVYGNDVVGLAYIPEGKGRVIVEWNPQFGIPTVTEDIKWPHEGYDTHFYFDPSATEVAVERRGYWHLDEHDRCLSVDANYMRSIADSNDGFRPVRGPLPKIDADLDKVGEEYVQKFLQQLEEDTKKKAAQTREDAANLPRFMFEEKYPVQASAGNSNEQ